MPIFLTTLLASVRSIFPSRAALELENLALRHQIAVLRRSAAKRLRWTSADRLLWICPSRLWHDWRSALNHRQARNGPGLASCRLSLVLDLEGAARPTGTAHPTAEWVGQTPRGSSLWSNSRATCREVAITATNDGLCERARTHDATGCLCSAVSNLSPKYTPLHTRVSARVDRSANCLGFAVQLGELHLG